jgi:hypothetical protein
MPYSARPTVESILCFILSVKVSSLADSIAPTAVQSLPCRTDAIAQILRKGKILGTE